LARKDRSIAGFDDVASAGKNNDNNNDNANANVNVNNSDQDFLDKLLVEGTKKKNDLVLVGIYMQPELASLLDALGKKGGRGAKSKIVNDALRKFFDEKGLI
jgi:predicted nicotinamide N-methyase